MDTGSSSCTLALAAIAGILLGSSGTYLLTQRLAPIDEEATDPKQAIRTAPIRHRAANNEDQPPRTMISGLSNRTVAEGRTGAPPDSPVTSSEMLQGRLGASFAELVARLRAQGVSEHHLTGLVSAEFEQRWRDQLAEVNLMFRRGEMDSSEREFFLQQYASAKEAAIRLLVGDEAFVTWDTHRVMHELNADTLDLSGEEAQALYELKKKHDQERRQNWLSHTLGETDAEDFRRIREDLTRLFEQQMSGLVGEDRYAFYRFDTDGSVGAFRREARGLGLPLERVDELYAVEQAYRERQQQLSAMLKDRQMEQTQYNQQLAQARQEQRASLEGLLGVDGYAQYRMVRNRSYQIMQRYAPAWRLSDPDIAHVYLVLENHRRTAGGTSSAQERESLQRQTETTLRNYLGDDRYERMARGGAIRL